VGVIAQMVKSPSQPIDQLYNYVTMNSTLVLKRRKPRENFMKTLRWTSQDLELLPENGKRYEIVDGELYVSKQLHLRHQIVCGNVFDILK
jgi:hypothetical protein